jgi:hypothetical protein
MRAWQMAVLLLVAMGWMAQTPAQEKAPPPKKADAAKDESKKDESKKDEPAKDKDAKTDKEPAKDAPKESPKEPESPAEVYARLLATDDNPIVRKRIVIALMGMKDDAKRALPALVFAASLEEKDKSVRSVALAAVKQFKPGDITDELSKAIMSEALGLPLRRNACNVLAAYYGNDDVSAEQRKTIYKSLEEVLANDNADLRVSAASALEEIDRQKRTGERAVRIILDVASLAKHKLKAEEVLDAIRKAKAKDDVNVLVEGRAYDWIPSPGDKTTATAFAELPIARRGGVVVTLREVARVFEAGEKK